MTQRHNLERMTGAWRDDAAAAGGAGGERSRSDPQSGFALLVSLLVLAALMAGSLGVFLASRAEVRIGTSHAASVVAFHAAEGGLATWLAAPAQPSAVSYLVGAAPVTVEARRLLVVDSATQLYHVAARARWPAAASEEDAAAVREITVLGRRVGIEPVEAVAGTWRETF